MDALNGAFSKFLLVYFLGMGISLTTEELESGEGRLLIEISLVWSGF